MSTPIPPPDQTPLWRRLLAILLLAVWPVVGFILLLGSAAEESNLLGQGFATLVEAPWWVATGACMALVSATLFALPASLRVAGAFVIGASSLALMTAWAPQTNSFAGGGAVSLSGSVFTLYSKYPAYASEVFFGRLSATCLPLLISLLWR